ncbi:MAG: T9SS type A sorting domain-containing protein [Bacteroidetes bacterium]|nr:T9SS type A sorting domain-containing protein [Bacteroidota bacterium]
MKPILLFIISVFFVCNVQAQPFSLDTTFKINYNFYSAGSGATVYNLNYEPDGKLMIYGCFNNGFHNPSSMLRIYEDGSLDNTWDYQMNDCVSFVKRLNNEYITLSVSLLVKFTYEGQWLDSAWEHNLDRDNICGVFYQPYIFSDGSILVGTDSICNVVSDKKRWLMRFLPDGNVDTNFRHNTNNLVDRIVKYNNNKLLLTGYFNKYDTISIFGMCRTDTTGNLDTTFHSIITSGIPYPIYVQNDGKIIVCGDMKIIGNPTRLRFIRLNIDGSLDSTFNNFNSIVYIPNTPCAASVACPTTDGGYLIGGQFRQYQGYVHNNIAKTDANGFIDTTYFNGLGIDSVLYPNLGIPPYVNSIVKGSNDNYYVMGSFTHYNGVKVNPIIRIHGLSVGINEVEKEKVKVYPNPAINSITFTGIYKDFKLTIFNAIGQIVLQKKLITSNTTLNIESFQRGMYYFQLINDKAKVINGKFVKN